MAKNLCFILGLSVFMCLPVKAKENIMKVYCGNKSLDIELADNLSAEAFAEKLSDGDITVKMSDYGGFEKTGKLGFDLPRSDENIKTSAGDVILYSGNTISIYYDENDWKLTRIGKIPNMTRESMLDFFGGYGDTDIIFSLK